MLFFYEFSLDEHVPRNHLLRSTDQFIDLADVRDHLKLLYSHTGRPSVDPGVMIRMLIIGYTARAFYSCTGSVNIQCVSAAQPQREVYVLPLCFFDLCYGLSPRSS